MATTDGSDDAIGESWRAPSPQEKAVLRRLLTSNFAGRDELVAQANAAMVRQIDPEGSLHFKVGGPVADVQSRVPVEGRYLDGSTDPMGPAVNILIHVVDGLLHELEVYKDDGSSIVMGPFMVPPGEIEVRSS
jgi:hypothetical protein